MTLQKELIDGVYCVTDSAAPGVPIVNLTGDGGDLIAYNANKLREINLNRLTIISADTTFYVATTGSDSTGDGSSGSPWATIAKALEHIGNYWINSAYTVTIQLADGTYTMTAATAPKHPCGPSINLQGTNTYATTMSAVYGSAGSAGAWSLVLTLADVSNIAAGDYVLIRSATGGTYPTFVNGCHYVSAVDTGNSRITITSKHKYATAPSGAVSAHVTVLKTLLQYNGCHGFHIDGAVAFGTVDKLVIVGNNTASTDGIRVEGGSLHAGVDLGVAGFGNSGAFVPFGGKLLCANSSSRAMCSSGNGNCGFQFAYATGSIPYVVASGNSNVGIVISTSQVYFDGALATGNTSIGVSVSMNGACGAGSPVATGNATGFHASSNGYGYIAGYTSTQNTTAISPAANTQGNEYGYWDT